MVTGPIGPVSIGSSTAAEWKNNIPSTGTTVISNPGLVGGYGGFQSVGGAVGSQGSTAGVSDPAIMELRNSGADNIRRISQLLKNAGYRVSVTSKYNEKLGNAYLEAIGKLIGEADRTGRPDLTLVDYLEENKQAGGKGRTIAGSVRITTPSDAAALIENVFNSELGRLPTKEEIALYTEKINKKEKKPSSATVGVPKLVNGRVITEYVGGFDRNQFLTKQIRKMPEYSQRKSESRSLTVQTLQGTANDNGVTLSPQQLDQYALDVENGKDIKVIQNQIRSLAGLGMPDNVKKLLAEGTDLSTIYSPYKRIMATILEIPENSISLNDPTLRKAIGSGYETVTAQPGMGGVSRGEYTMTLYDFQRSLRKDPRWQYTNNAREEVSNAVLGVLRDFGFQG